MRCAQRGVVVKVDGEPFVDCPGERTRRMSPGKHVVVGSAPQLLTGTIDAVVSPGKLETIDVQLQPVENGSLHRSLLLRIERAGSIIIIYFRFD